MKDWDETSRYTLVNKLKASELITSITTPDGGNIAMVATALVNRQIKEGRMLIERLDQTAVRFDVAFWMLIPDTDNWRLMLGTRGVNRYGTRKKYELIQSVLKQLPMHLSLSEISVVDTNSDLCNRLRTAVQASEDLTPIPFFGNFIDGHSFPDSVIYRVR